MMSKSTTDLHGGSADSRKAVEAWGTVEAGQTQQHGRLEPLRGDSTSVPIKVPEESSISVALMRIADTLARKVLPWQAALCPRAVETLYNLRFNISERNYIEFMDNMKKKLEDKGGWMGG